MQTDEIISEEIVEPLSEEQWQLKFDTLKILEPINCSNDKLKIMRELIYSNPCFNHDQRLLFVSTYRAATSSKRNGLRMLAAITDQQKHRGKSDKTQKLDEIRSTLQLDLFNLYNEVQQMIDNYLLPKASDSESKALYFLAKADFFRYMHEFANKTDQIEYEKNAEEFYQKAYEMPLSKESSLSLSISLNYSVFLYEVQKQKKKAIEVAQQALDESGILVNDGNDENFTESTTLQALLRENIFAWTRDEVDS